MNFISFIDLIEGKKKYALLLFVIMFLAAIAEGVGLSLLLPLLSGLIGVEGEASGILKYLELTFCLFPPAYRMEGLMAVLVVVFFLKSLMMILHRGMSVNFGMQLREKWSSEIFSRCLEANYKDIINQKQGFLINNIITEPLRASKSVTMLLELFCRAMICIVLFGILLATDWKITLMALIVGGIALYLPRRTADHYSVGFGTERLRLNQQITAMAAEGVSGIKEIKVFGISHRYLSALAGKLNRLTRINTKFAVLTEAPRYIMEFVVALFVVVVLSYLHITRSTELKNAVPFLGFFVLVCQRLVSYVSFIVAQRMKVVSFFPSLHLIHTMIYEDKSKKDYSKKIKVEQISSEIIFKDVGFSYEDRGAIFTNLNMTIPIGKMTAIVGPSGVGKSTIADLVLGLLTPQKGEILVNGLDIRQIDLKSLTSRIGYVGQEPIIFNASIRENILAGRLSANEDEVVHAGKMANIHDFITGLSEGYDTVVGDRGQKLSGGQRQRLAIARAIIRQPDFFIFDEATSSLDIRSEKVIQRSIEQLSHTKTVLVIAHRISTLQKADIIYVLDKGGKIRVEEFETVRKKYAGFMEPAKMTL